MKGSTRSRADEAFLVLLKAGQSGITTTQFAKVLMARTGCSRRDASQALSRLSHERLIYKRAWPGGGHPSYRYCLKWWEISMEKIIRRELQSEQDAREEDEVFRLARATLRKGGY